MDHPQDRSGVSRRRLLQGAAGGALGIGALGLLAGCENTTTAIGACEGGDGSSNLVVAKPTGPGGLPLPRPDNAVTWAITEDNKPIADGVPDENGPLGIYNYADYLDPSADQEVREAHRPQGAGGHLQLVRRGDREALLRRGRLRPDHRALGLEHRQPDRPAAAPAAQPLVPAELREERLARAAGPVLRPRQQVHGAVRRLVGRDRVAQRQDHAGHRGDGRALGHLLGVPGLQGQGRDPRRQARRRSRCRCSATRCAPAAGPISTPRTRRSSPRRARISAS